MWEYIDVFLFLLCVVLFFFAIVPILFVIKGDKMREMEKVLGGGKRLYSHNFMLAGVGGMHFGGFYVFKWTARRYGVADKLHEVSASTQAWFKAYFILMWTVFVLFFGSAAVFGV